MSEEGGGKIKAKKAHSQPKPYERQKVSDNAKDYIGWCLL